MRPLIPLEAERPRNARLWPAGTPAAGSTVQRPHAPPPLIQRSPGGGFGAAKVKARRAKLRRVLPCRIGDARRLLPIYGAITDRPDRVVRRDLLAIGAVEQPGGVWALP